jgi:RNA polymerase sigma factor (sigma-70 family)
MVWAGVTLKRFGWRQRYLAVLDDLDEIARKVRAGEPEGFSAFAETFGALILRRYLYHGLAMSEAESLAVTAVSDIALKVDRFSPRGPGSFRAWVLHSADNLLRDQLRQRRPRLLADASFLAAPMEPEDEARVDGLAQAVRSAIAELGEPDRTIVSARLEDPDRTFTQIGAAVGLEESTARVRYHRALKKLARGLGDQSVVREWLGRLRPSEHGGGDS